MSPRFVGIRPDEVVWKSLAMPWWQKVVRRYAVNAFICAMILFWAIPVAFVGVVSNIPALTNEYKWLAWINSIPSVILGVITGLLPAVLLAILMSLVPIIMRLCAKLAGEPSISRVELFTQKAYFAFQVVQVFLVATVASSATEVAAKIANDPSQTLNILSTSLPKSSNLYISYFIVQGLTIATGVLTQVVGFFVFTILYKLLARTPRAMYNKWSNLSAISWGSTLPVYANIAVIAITYSGIAPLMLGWATIAMGLFYLAWRYNVFFVTDTQIDTRGLIYPVAIKQLFVGLYLGEVCMTGLFITAGAYGPIVLTVILLIFTILFHITLNNALDPLLFNLPMTLLAEEESRLLDTEAGVTAGPSATVDSEKPLNGDSAVEHARLASAKTKKGNLITKFLKPWIYADYETFRALLPHGVQPEQYSDEIHRNAYFPPSTVSDTPLLWIPSDAAGVSKQEVAHTSKVIPITDEGCELDAKGKLVWDVEGTRPPIWDEKVYY